ncbi:MAG TPA: DUF3426 domain-containing protein [Arenimonas sp.]|uniref:DUF3426 domain-containing protein n=1 Tax=Arenimonas sp. TaxID=1872635 RepID=UPI002B637418|nr:DUF3426 domain-containing protein [Arenimonas sp.]HMB55920.1 DUF3426 domain-containing protein [Arenimonas sp.]
MSRPSPDFLQPSAPTPKPRRDFWLWFVLPWLLLALVLQIAVADRARLAADPEWRPRIEMLCDFLRCSLPPWHEPTAFHVTSREIRPHPSVPEVLLVSASFRNDAKFAQAWPQLQLSLSNLDGDSLGLRRFSPRDYLGSAPATTLIAPGQSASITLEILDPGKRAVAFSFEFR